MSTCKSVFWNAIRLGVFSLFAIAPLQVRGGFVTFALGTPVQVIGNEYYSDVTLSTDPSNVNSPSLASFFIGFTSGDPNFLQFENASDEVANYIFANHSTLDDPYTGTASILLSSDPGPPPTILAGDLYSVQNAGVPLVPGTTVGMTRVYFDYAPNQTPTATSIALVTDPNDPNFLSLSDPNSNSLVTTLTDNGNGTYNARLNDPNVIPEPSSLMMAAMSLAAGGVFWFHTRRRQRARSARSFSNERLLTSA